MYIWIGCKLPVAFEAEMRQRCLALNQKIGLDTTAFSLPQHISLKISFATEKAEAVLQHLQALLATQQRFSVTLQAPEQMGNILWLPVAEQPVLQLLHRQLDTRLALHFGIPQHPFDKDFRFHSTLFIDPDPAKIAQMKALLTDEGFPRKLEIDTFLLGTSESGAAGSYRVQKEIQI